MRRLRALWMRFLGLFAGERADQEFSAELQSHLQLHIEDNLRSGMTPEEARRRALIQLGGMEQTKIAYRERRGLPFIETLGQDVRYGTRLLAKSPAFACMSVATLALGIGATTAIFSVVKAVILAPLPYKDPGRIVAVWTNDPTRGGEPIPSSAGDFGLWKQKNG